MKLSYEAAPDANEQNFQISARLLNYVHFGLNHLDQDECPPKWFSPTELTVSKTTHDEK